MLRSLARTTSSVLILSVCCLPALSAQTPLADPAPAPVPLPSPPTGVLAPMASPTPPTPPRPTSFGPWWRNSQLSAEIDLDAATIDRLEQVFLDHRLRLAELAEELDRSRAAADFERHRSERDMDALRSAEDGFFEVRGLIEATRTELLVEIRSLLSAAQWTQLSDFQRRHRPPVPAVPTGLRAARPGAVPRLSAPPAPPSPPFPPSPTATPSPRPAAPLRPSVAPPAPLAPLAPAPPALSWWTDTRVRAELDLGVEQLRALESETKVAAQGLRDLQRAVRREEEELSHLVASEDLDRDTARAQVKRLTAARSELRHAGRDLERRLLEVLTPQQRRRLTSL